MKPTTIRVRIRLEPALEAISSDWSAPKCRGMAAKCRRYARQFEMKAIILERDATTPPKRLKRLKPELTSLN